MPGPNVIVIGASAGGIQALQTIVGGFPPDFEATVFIVVHTAANDGNLATILGRKTSLRTVKAEDGMRVTEKTIFVAPPNHHLLIHDSRLSLSLGPKVNRHRPAIDPLFESAAEAFRHQVIGVVLTGYLDDGTAGLAAVKKRGGIAVVQDPDDAEAPNMPRNALAGVDVDYCLPAAEIAALLVGLVKGKSAPRNRRG